MESCTCHFIFLTGSRAGEIAEFTSARLTVGRASVADIQFDPQADLTVASLHAEILYDSGSFILCDLGSRSGTFVNGDPIAGPYVLKNDDYVQFGQNGPEVVFRTGPKPGTVVPPKPPILISELHFRTGSLAGKRFRITSERPVTIGRLAHMDIALDPVENIQVSGHHCTIFFNNGHFWVRDHSRNGTFVNDSPVRQENRLSDGDVLKLAPGGPVAIFRVLGSVRYYPNKATTQDRARGNLPTEPAVAASAQGYPKSNILKESGQATNYESTNSTDPDLVLEGNRENKPAATGGTTKNPPPPIFPSKRVRFSTKWVTVGTMLVVLVASGWVMQKYPSLVRTSLFRSHEQTSGANLKDYLEQINKGTVWENAVGGYSVVIPREWAKLRNGAIISIESPDKVIAVDYVVDSRLNEDAVVQLLRAKGAQPKKVAETSDSKEKTVTFVGRGGNRVWLAVLRSTYEVQMLALFDVSIDQFNLIPNEVYTQLAFQSFKPTRLPSPGTAAGPVLRPDEETSLSLPLENKDVRAQLSLVTSEELSSPSAQLGLTSGETTESLVICEPARIGLYLPGGWTAKAIPSEGVLLVDTRGGLEIRVTRDSTPLDARAVFAEMQKDGWKPLDKDEEGKALGGLPVRIYLAFMQQNVQHACLGLIDQLDSSTLVAYTQKPEPFSDDQRDEIREALVRLAQFSTTPSR
ncbi:MAG: FHA domain-containing protein [Candidatus Sumerlaeaceae bacterium]|nr:FHA domain-containing protein [Candidatus Sumerlaeaceae bacterium]